MNIRKNSTVVTVLRHALTIVAAAVLAACASSQRAPDDVVARAASNIDQAEMAGARQYASAELESAKERLSMAREALSDDQYIVAEEFAEEAQLDAALASAKARSVKANEAVAEIEEGIATLRQEISRNQSNTGDMP